MAVDMGDLGRITTAVQALITATTALNHAERRRFLDDLEDSVSDLINQANTRLDRQESKRPNGRLVPPIRNPYEEM